MAVGRAGEVDCVLLLLSVGQISVNKTNKLGDTPAILAAHHGRSHCLDALLQVLYWNRNSAKCRIGLDGGLDHLVFTDGS